MFTVDKYGLRAWQVTEAGSRDVFHKECYFTANEPYSRWFPAFRATQDVGSISGSFMDNGTEKPSVGITHQNATIWQSWSAKSPTTLSGVIKVIPRVSGIQVWGLARLHVQIPNATEVYPPPPSMSALAQQNLAAFFPSSWCRIGGNAWITSSGNCLYVRLRGECTTKRHLLYWEKYPSDGRYALHIIFAWPLDITTPATIEVELSTVPFPSNLPQQSAMAPTGGRPVIMCCRAMAEYIKPENPHGYVNVRLDDYKQAMEYNTPLAQRAARIKALGIIGWPWGYTSGFGLSEGRGHEYPYNAFNVPEPLRSHLKTMWAMWGIAGAGAFGALYRPYWYEANGKRCWRFGDRTSQWSMKEDFEGVFKPDLLYMDDCGVDPFSGTFAEATVGDFITNLAAMRSAFGSKPAWFIEHPSSATLPYAGGYVVLEKHPDGSLCPNIGRTQWEWLRKEFPNSSWLVAAGSKLWGDHVQVQQDVIDWCRAEGGNVSPLVQDWLLTQGLTAALEKGVLHDHSA